MDRRHDSYQAAMNNRLPSIDPHLLDHGSSSSMPWGDIPMSQVLEYHRTHPPPHLRHLCPLSPGRLETEIFEYRNLARSRQPHQNHQQERRRNEGNSGFRPSSTRHANRNGLYDGVITLDLTPPYRQRRPGPVDPRHLRPAPPLPEVLAYAPNSSRAARKMVKIEEVKLEDIKQELVSMEETTYDNAPSASALEEVKDVKPLAWNKFDEGPTDSV